MDQDIRIPEKKRRWPYDAAVTISLIALVLSAAQLLVTAPLFSQLLLSPELVAYSKKINGDKSLSGIFLIKNMGNSSASNVEIGLISSSSDKILLLPNLVSDIKDARSDEVIFKNRLIKIDRLLPGEHFTVIVIKGSLRAEDKEAEDRILGALNMAKIPAVTFLRSTEGVGKILP